MQTACDVFRSMISYMPVENKMSIKINGSHLYVQNLQDRGSLENLLCLDWCLMIPGFGTVIFQQLPSKNLLSIFSILVPVDHAVIIGFLRYVMSPPIRKSGHNNALQAALSTGILQVSFSPTLFIMKNNN